MDIEKKREVVTAFLLYMLAIMQRHVTKRKTSNLKNNFGKKGNQKY